jgi:hypothetical protein
MGVLGAAVLLTCTWAFLRTTKAPMSYMVEGRFEEFSPDDKEFRGWLRGQPGIIRAWVGRFGEDGKPLVISFSQVRNLLGQPPIPDLNEACKEFGCRGQDGPFRDSADRERSFGNQDTE